MKPRKDKHKSRLKTRHIIAEYIELLDGNPELQVEAIQAFIYNNYRRRRK